MMLTEAKKLKPGDLVHIFITPGRVRFGTVLMVAPHHESGLCIHYRYNTACGSVMAMAPHWKVWRGYSR
jgi:hypothetical protein